ncbi:L-2-amino-thiazoline-4-carboxylic acid hydrolase [Acetanaerobacterium elongatum]|uniref:L-2-amino-thiazoline-4-carboxylic acid hydrolase n=1 Tax=Acetanaerobacterium elongatum TaxID=258515 RepID=A0A1G9UP96_9FIRM|nr:L-2-amino-thiazoline-4-carboxylic acid hydrolase [Acetanaerobacterium elongatum]SDM61664.1 L-2-amino-thiazoline-4-carboxylic acid hydrolase [Acetanaerobacterium elongatum]
MPQSKNDNPFRKTILPNLRQALITAFSNKTGNVIYHESVRLYQEELAGMNDRNSKVIHNHLSNNILPAYAAYKILLQAGIEQSKALEFIRQEVFKSMVSPAAKMRRLGTLPFIYGLFKTLMKPVVGYGYPKEGWDIEWKEYSKTRLAFNMKSCLYCEELKKRGVPELCPIFCETDELTYNPLAPRVVFERGGTLAKGCAVCDFSYKKGHK